MFDTNFDKQKLMYHPREVAAWLEHGRTEGPIYTEMELCSACDCRCIFCGVDYLVNKTRDTIDVGVARKAINNLHAIGNKSIMFCGHGESLLHPQADQIIACAGELMSTSITTNGLSLTEDRLSMIDRLEWLRFSINGCDPENYAAVHGVAPKMFELALSHVAGAVRRKEHRSLDVAIGSQLVLLEENAHGVVKLARRLKEIGVDYFSVKPYSQHPLSHKHLKVPYERFAGLENELRALEDGSFKVIYRSASMAKANKAKPYRKCYGTHFLCFISANGDVWECNVFAGDPKFRIGNVAEESLADIWNGRRRREVLAYIENEMNVNHCRDICRMDECNRFLWRLRHPWPHDNFV